MFSELIGPIPKTRRSARHTEQPQKRLSWIILAQLTKYMQHRSKKALVIQSEVKPELFFKATNGTDTRLKNRFSDTEPQKSSARKIAKQYIKMIKALSVLVSEKSTCTL